VETFPGAACYTTLGSTVFLWRDHARGLAAVKSGLPDAASRSLNDEAKSGSPPGSIFFPLPIESVPKLKRLNLSQSLPRPTSAPARLPFCRITSASDRSSWPGTAWHWLCLIGGSRGKSPLTTNQKTRTNEKTPLSTNYGCRRPRWSGNFRAGSPRLPLWIPLRLRVPWLRISLLLSWRPLRLLGLAQRLPILASSSRAGTVSALPLTELAVCRSRFAVPGSAPC
jgi:hypothetical protein